MNGSRFAQSDTGGSFAHLYRWVFILIEADADMMRLILRTRVNYGPRLFRVLTSPFFWPVDFVLARKMLL